MSVHAYTENQLVEQPAIGLFAELGWAVAGPPPNAGVAGEPADAGLLGRETKGEVVLVGRLRAALKRLNPSLPPEAITAAVDELTRDRSAMLLAQANREVYRLLKEGIPVSVADTASTPHPPHPQPLSPSDAERVAPGRGGEGGGGGQRIVRVRGIDWEQPANNDFLLVSQFSVTGALYTCRLDLLAFVNGLPLVVIELKKPGVPARAAFDENLTSYKREIDTSPQPSPRSRRRGRHCSCSTRCSSPRTARTAASARSRRIGSGASRSEPDWRSTHRARGRAAPGVAGGDASRDVRQVAAARLGGKLHAVLVSRGGSGENHRAESPVSRRHNAIASMLAARKRGHRRRAPGAAHSCRVCDEAHRATLSDRPAAVVASQKFMFHGGWRTVLFTIALVAD